MKVESFIFDPSLPDSPQLQLAGKMYCKDDADCVLEGGVSLLLAHASALRESFCPS